MISSYDQPAAAIRRADDALLASADADQMFELIARATAAIPVDDERKIRRRLAGERRDRVSREARDTALRAERLAVAIETVVSPSTATRRARI